MTLNKDCCPMNKGCLFVEFLGTNSKNRVLGFPKFLIWWTNEGGVKLSGNIATLSDGRGVQAWSNTQLPLPCIGINESDSKLYTNFELCEEINHKHLKNTLIYKAKQFMLPKKKFKKSLYILEDTASSVQVDILNTQLSKKLFKTWQNYIKLNFFYKFLYKTLLTNVRPFMWALRI